MIRSDYNLVNGRTAEQWEIEQLGEYIPLVNNTATMLRQLAGLLRAATETIQQAKLPTRICSDDVECRLADVLENIIDLDSLGEYLKSRREEVEHSIKPRT